MKIENVIFLAISCMLFILVVWKAAAIPVTHDEVATPVHYIHFSVWEIMMYPDPWPNNHILNTLLTKAVVAVLGICAFCIRIPSVLSFIIYAWAVYRLIQLYPKIHIAWYSSMVLIFLLNPYLLDFFSLCRGYGMAVAWCTLSLSYLVSAIFFKRDAHRILAVLFSMLAAYANFTLLVYWAAVQLLVGFSVMNKYKGQWKTVALHLAVYIAAAAGFLLLVYTPIRKMTQTDQFVYWSSNGFYNDTIKSLWKAWTYNQNWYRSLPGDLLPLLGVAISLVVLIAAVALWLRKNNPQLLPAVSLMIITVCISTLQHLILETPFLSGRTALLFYPLYAHVLLSSGIWFSEKKHTVLPAVLGLMLLAVVTLNFIFGYNMQSTLEWWYDANTDEVIEYIKDREEASQDTVVLNTHWMFQPSFNFYEYINESGNITVPDERADLDFDSGADYYYVFEDDIDTLGHEFKKLREFGWGRWLVQKENNN